MIVFERLTRRDLAVIGREYLLAGHLIDRAGMPQLIAEGGLELMRDVAIEEWMGASPVYTRRTQRTLGFEGNDVATIFRGIQLDIGAPHRFMDFRYKVDDANHGEFWLASCGALMDVEPMGEEFVTAMCHHIEDPTFDATAAAVNPRARMRPLHRPPRTPADRHPHCHWTVEISDDADPLPEPEAAVRVAKSRAAAIPIAYAAEPTGDFDPEFALEYLPRSVLAAALGEVCLQGHLLVHSFMNAVEDRLGAHVTRQIAGKQLIGVGGLTSWRLAGALDVAGIGLDGVWRVLELHPAFLPREYAALEVERQPDALTVSIGACPALEEVGGRSWAAVMAAFPGLADKAMATIVQGADPRARCERTGRLEWEVTLDPAGEPAPQPDEVLLTRFSTGADFALER
jgi:hypothetical protein